MKNNHQSGRSMVEMLGILAIIGVISVTGLMGYAAAMRKHRANELMNEAAKRAMMMATQLMAGKEAPTLDDFDNNEVGGVTFKNPAAQTDTFSIDLEGVDNDLCDQLRILDDASIMNFNEECSQITFNKDLSIISENGASSGGGNSSASNYNGNPEGCTGAGYQYCTSNGTCIELGETCPCDITPETDCLSGALMEGECVCAPAADETKCTSWTTNECGKGKYCKFSPEYCEDEHPTGKCKLVSSMGDYKNITFGDHEYTISDYTSAPRWWDAQSWCKAFGKTLVSLSDLHCTTSVCTDTFWQGLGNAVYGGDVMYKFKSTWTTDKNDDCAVPGYGVGLFNGKVYNDNNAHDVLCK